MPISSFRAQTSVPAARPAVASKFCAAAVFTVGLLASAHGQVSTTPIEGLRDATPRAHAIVGARIVTAPGVVIDRGTVILRDGVIVAVGAASSIVVPADARVWPAEGKTVYPGFLEPLAEVNLPAALRADGGGEPAAGGRGGRGGAGAAAGAGTEALAPAAAARSWNARVTPERDVARVLVSDDRGTAALRELGFTAAVVAPSRGVFRGESAMVSLSGRPPGASLLRARLAQHLAFEQGAGAYPASLMGSVALLRQTLLDAKWLRDASAAHEKNPALERPEANASLEALTDYVGARKPVVFDTQDELDLLRAQAVADEFGLKLVLRGRGADYRMVSALAAKKTPVIVPLNFPAVPEVETPDKAADVALSTLQHWELAPSNAARLTAQGVPVAFTTAGLRAPDTQFWNAVRLAVRRGLAPASALAAVTTVPAQVLGVADLVGTIAPGKLGHLVVATGDLFAGEGGAEITEVWVDGIRFETEAAQRVDARGTWTIAWRGATAPVELRIESRGGARPRVRLGDKDLTFTQSRGQLTLLAPAELFQGKDAKGTVRLAGTVTGNAIEGSGLLADGTAFRWSAQRTTTPERATPPAPREEKFLANAEAWPAGAYGRKGLPAQPEFVLVKNATIWTGGSAGRIDGGSLLVRAGKIDGVGKYLEAPPGAVVIDAAGKHVTAGLIDCHSHTAISRGVNEGTSAVTVEVRVGDALDATDVSIYRQLGGGTTTANLLHGSANPMGGQNQVIKLRWGALPEGLKFAGAKPGVKFALGENVKQSSRTPTPGVAQRYPATRMGVEQIMADTFAQARDYERALKAAPGAALPARRNLRLESALEILKGERLVHIHSYRQDEVLMFVRLAQREKLSVATFQHILEGYKVADEIAKLGAGASAFTDWWAYKYEVVDAIPYAGAIMHNAGVLVSFNSDNNELARRLNTEAAKAVKYGGVPEEEALKFVTLNPAKQLRIDDRVGSLERGKDADFVIWSASPLSSYARAEQTWIDGRMYFSLAEDAELRTAAATEREALAQKALAERMRTLGGAGAPAAGGRGATPAAAAEPTPDIIRILLAMEAHRSREFQGIYHDGADALNCTTHAP